MGADEGASPLRSRAAVAHERPHQRRDGRRTKTSSAETAAVCLPTALQRRRRLATKTVSAYLSDFTGSRENNLQLTYKKKLIAKCTAAVRSVCYIVAHLCIVSKGLNKHALSIDCRDPGVRANSAFHPHGVDK